MLVDSDLIGRIKVKMSNYTNFQYGDDKNKPWYKIIGQISANTRVLDIGCSSGSLGELLKKEKGCQVVGVDLDKDDIEIAKKKLDQAFVLNIESDELGILGTFDFVIFADVIEHLVDPVGVLKRVKTLLNSKGSVLFSIPNMAHMSTRLMLLKGRFKYGEIGLLDKTHIHFYDKEEIERVFNSAGYGIEVFDWVERYLPEDLVAQQLQELGLTGSKDFFDMNKSIEALAYEYVGKAVPGGKVIQKQLDFISPYATETEERVSDIKKSYENRLVAYQKSAKRECLS